MAGCIISADGVCQLWERWWSPARIALSRVILAATVFLVACVVAIYAIRTVLAQGSVLDRYAAWFALLLLVAGIGVIRARRGPASLRPRRWATLLVGLVLFGALEAPLQVVPPVVAAVRHGRPTYSRKNRDLTAGLFKGLTWIRDHTSPNAVLAVNNYYTDAARKLPGYMYYSAFSERRVFLEGWGETVRTGEIGTAAVLAGRRQPFPTRLRLNNAVFQRADRAALRILVVRYGVRYLVVDKVHGSASPGLAALATPVFDNSDIAVYRIAG